MNVQIDSECAKAYAEVIEILKYVPIEYLVKIPKEKIEFYKAYMDSKYEYRMNKSLDFESQPISPKALAVLANLFKDYWATAEEKNKILELEQYEFDLIEEKKKKQYSVNDLFKNKSNEELNNNSIVEYQEKTRWYNKIVILIKNYLKR